MTGPLNGLRVLDLTQMLAGPYCTMMLADQGAEVIKIEPPEGDPARSFAPSLPGMTDFGGYFQSINRNKLSVALDLKSSEGVQAFMELVRTADVVVTLHAPRLVGHQMTYKVDVIDVVGAVFFVS